MHAISKEILTKQLEQNFADISNNAFTYKIKQKSSYFLVQDLSHKLVLRKLNDNIKRLYKDEQANRRIIIKQIKTLLEETCPIWILKTDIEGFYENINREKIITKLKSDMMLSHHSLSLLEVLFSSPLLSCTTGLPRGLNISSTLSEIYMRKFDRWVQREDGVYYYARFVDDIIIFCSDKEKLIAIKNKINANLPEGLKMKQSKTAVFEGLSITESNPLQYLGYKFTVRNKNNSKNDATTLIATKKVKKIKTRITASFLDYLKTSNFQLLVERIKFLTGNYSIRKSDEGVELKAGIFYNYPHLSDPTDLDRLNLYYRKLLHSKNGSLGKKIDSSLTREQKQILQKYSFTYGYKNKVHKAFKRDQMSHITHCWK